MKLFKLTILDRTHDVTGSDWFTWSDEFRCFLRELWPFIAGFPKPALIRLAGHSKYDKTFEFPVPLALPRALAVQLQTLGASLVSLRVPGGRIMLTDLLDREITRTRVHYLLALLRSSIAAEFGDPFAALYAPLGTTGHQAGDFRLHADLYSSHMLLNILDAIAPDGSGASTFLPMHRFLKIAAECPSMSRRARTELRKLLLRPITQDGYEQFVELVYGLGNAWAKDLWRAMSGQQEKVWLRRGEGYLLHDRKWLHGRTAPKSAVSRWRVHRLTFRAVSTVPRAS